SLTLAPNQTEVVTVTKSVPASALGTFTVVATAGRGGMTGSASAEVQVLTGCSAAPASLAVSPGERAVEAGDDAVYDVTVTNKDTGNCQVALFQLGHDVPVGWSGHGFMNIGLMAGQSFSSTFTASTPPSAAAGSYTLGLTLTRNGSPGGAVTTLMVCDVTC